MVVEEQLVATSLLAGQLDGFAAQLADDKVRLDERLSQMANAASTEQRTLEAKLATVETTFRRCDAAPKELQTAVFAAPAARSDPSPGTEPPGLGGLRDRLDELSREAH